MPKAHDIAKTALHTTQVDRNRPKNDALAQTGKTAPARGIRICGERTPAMDRFDWLIALVVRTIGAERGRAARGRPKHR